jgi:integrase/recombinase XerD
MTDECISPLRRRMIEDMTVRNFVPKTQSDYNGRALEREEAVAKKTEDERRRPVQYSPGGAMRGK